jgi:FkbM family methyltransferase
MKFLRNVLDAIFYSIHPIFKPAAVQLFLRQYIALPFSMTEHLKYKGVVSFVVGTKELFMQSYNTPIEITVFWRGIFRGREGAELSLWSKLSKDANVAIDIGANNGIYALVSSVNQNLKIHAFEPVPKVYDMLLENMELNKTANIVPHQMVVSSSDGVETLFVPKEGWVDVASLNEVFANKYTEGREMVKIDCKAITLDSFLLQNNISTKENIICKIDVEGAEPMILAGAQKTIKENNISFLIETLFPSGVQNLRC